MKRLTRILIVLIVVLLGLCAIRIEPKRIAYGHFAGECIGNCGTVYEVTAKVLRVDTTSFWQTRNDLRNLNIKGQRYLEEDDEGNFNSKKLSIPLIMLLDPRTIFGCPDCHDQGGYYLDFTLFGFRRHFEIDKESEPFYYSGLTKKIDKKIDDVVHEFTQYGR